MVASSSTEVGCVAMDHAMKEAMWLCTLLSLIRYTQKELTLIQFEYIPTDLNSANIHTKGLNHPKHWKSMDMLGVQGKLNG